MNLTGKTVKYTKRYVESFTLSCPSAELTKWYERLNDIRFLVVYDDEQGPTIAVKSDKVYAVYRSDVEVAE